MMPWSQAHFPDSFKSLTVPVRNKAIEIANALLEENGDGSRAIAIATAKAKEWAENRDLPIKEDPNAGPDVHVVPTENGWVAREVGKHLPLKEYATKADAIEAGRKVASENRATLIIHGQDGQIQETRGYSGA